MPPPPPKKYTITNNNQSFTLLCPAEQALEYVLQEIFVQQDYPFLPFLLPRVQVIVDIGAHLGCATVLFRAQYPAAKIYAFEPDPETFRFLELNTAPLGNVYLYNHGLWDRDATARLYLGKDSSATSSMSRCLENTADFREIRLRRAGPVLAELGIGRIGILKLDTEGAEVPILREIEHLLDRVDAILVEYHSEKDRREIDHLLGDRFTLYQARAGCPHRGTNAYVSREILGTLTSLNHYAIERPRL